MISCSADKGIQRYKGWVGIDEEPCGHKEDGFVGTTSGDVESSLCQARAVALGQCSREMQTDSRICKILWSSAITCPGKPFDLWQQKYKMLCFVKVSSKSEAKDS